MENQMVDFDVNLFKQRLKETILWCRYKIAQSTAPTPEILWSLADQSLLRVHSEGYRCYLPLSFYTSDRQLMESIDKVFAQRSQLVTALPPPLDMPENTLFGGRLAIFFIHDTASDAAAELESREFFDGDNLPACDTWVYFHNKDNRDAHVVSWVPPEFREDAENGIAVNPEECIRWLDAMAPWGDFYRNSYLPSP